MTSYEISTMLTARDNVTATAAAVHSPYGYVPWESAGVIFALLFGITTLVHLVQSFRYGMKFLLPTAVLCGVFEIIGWGARLYSHFQPHQQNPYIIQIVTTIVAPIPLTAANFIILERIIRKLGPRYSRLSPRNYLRLFLATDVVAFLIQAGGGTIAANATTLSGANQGGNIMLGGIIIQLVFMILFIGLTAEVFYRYNVDASIRQPTDEEKLEEVPFLLSDHPRTLVMIEAGAFSTFCLLVRAVYRTIELADGWDGTVILTQSYFIIFDALMVTLAMFAINFFHPGYLLH
ncbi:RTA1-domain-containing protein [Coniophora puteana RWD-64-598 SS2]|uniref:RTA1-domain-containing protein n=1 Tax=Coniophora puteana (strain RWD-64-598) TaxID=741705 RepID=A0A5M3MCQ8_CONPW|nr:RTA1-domain-containing protein [Coniophora puteana RWD-64-598 SS2]EIW77042.1 RTA1-domain-containing protein [Coniophora puteana RWD-64-598 SS2]